MIANHEATLPEALITAIVRGLGADTSRVTGDGFIKQAVKCPATKHAHDKESPAAYWHVDKHFLKCHKCGVYNAHDTAKHLGINPDDFYSDRVKVENTKRTYDGLIDYAKAHGVSADVFISAGWHEVQHMNRPALCFEVNGQKRYRFLDDRKPVYISEAGFKIAWYGLKRAIRMARQYDRPIVICNGEASTIVAQHYDIPAIARTSGEQKLEAHLIDELRESWNGEVIIALDCDNKGRQASSDIAAQLTDMKLAIKDLGLSDGGDLADYCKLHGSNAYFELVKGVTYQTPTLELIAKDGIESLARAMQQLAIAQRTGDDTDDLVRRAKREIDRIENVTARPVVVDSADASVMALARLERIRNSDNKVAGVTTGIPTLDVEIGGMQEGTTTVIYGATSMGKSVFITSVIAHLMRNWKDLRALVISTETVIDRYQNRIAGSMTGIPYSKINKAYLLDDEEYDIVKRALGSIAARRWDFLDAVSPSINAIRKAVFDSIKSKGIGLVVIDSISNLFNAGNYDEVQEVSNGVLALARETGLPFLVSSQVGRDVSKRGRGNKMPTVFDGYGGGVLENNAETVASLYRPHYYVAQGLEEAHPGIDEHTAIMTLLKARDGEMGKKVHLKWEAGARYSEQRKI